MCFINPALIVIVLFFATSANAGALTIDDIAHLSGLSNTGQEALSVSPIFPSTDLNEAPQLLVRFAPDPTTGTFLTAESALALLQGSDASPEALELRAATANPKGCTLPDKLPSPPGISAISQ